MTTITSCTPLLNVADVEASLGFWRDLIGFAVTYRYEPDGRLMYASLQSGEVRLMLNGRGGDPADRRARPHYTEAVLSFGVPSVHQLVRDLRAKGFDAPEPAAESYGLDEIVIRDPDGYEIAFTSPIAELPAA
jgi:catechol 2,3-dioxygenase-like lactoylglutathione lyase family enzyme